MARILQFPRRTERSGQGDQVACAAFREAMATLDRLEALLGKVEPAIQNLGDANISEILLTEIAEARAGLLAARHNAMLLEGTLPV